MARKGRGHPPGRQLREGPASRFLPGGRKRREAPPEGRGREAGTLLRQAGRRPENRINAGNGHPVNAGCLLLCRFSPLRLLRGQHRAVRWERSLCLLPTTLTHRSSHNVRRQFQPRSSKITPVGRIISEGIAERFAAGMFWEDPVGKWVRRTTAETLQRTIQPLLRKNPRESDFQKLSTFLYGDGIMALRVGRSAGMPYRGGYACGYALVGHHLAKTGAFLYRATVTPVEEILRETKDLWR